MVRALLILLMGGLSAFGQAFTLRDQAFVGVLTTPVGGELKPTDAAIGTTFWWEPSVGAYVTNSSIATLPEQAVGAAYNLTNAGTQGTFPSQGPSLNSKSTLSFDGSGQWLNSVILTTAQPFEVVMLIALTNNGGAGNEIFAAIHDVNYRMASELQQLYTGFSLEALGLNITNKWHVLDVLFNGNSSTGWSNQVQMATGLSGQGATALDQFHVMIESGLYNPTKGNIAAIFMKTNGNFGTATWSSPRSNLFYYISNRYALPLP